MSQSCGIASIIGLPNTGKSTLVNKLVGAKVSIVSSKIQTTRARILGIALHEETQIILLDTPGVFSPKKTMEKAMFGAAIDAMSEGDVIVHMVDMTRRGLLEENKVIHDKLPKNRPVFLVLNKIDQVDKIKLLEMTTAFNDAYDYDKTFMISALKGAGVKDLTKALAAEMPDGPWHYDEDQITTTPMRMLAAEITREKLFEQTHREVPYSVLVETEVWEEFDNGDVKISQVITVERDSQKAIVLGKGGARIKQIGQASRMDLEAMLERTVHIKLFVRVQDGWQERAESYEIMGF